MNQLILAINETILIAVMIIQALAVRRLRNDLDGVCNILDGLMKLQMSQSQINNMQRDYNHEITQTLVELHTEGN